MYPFEYASAKNLAEAVKLLKTGGAMPISGGQSLIPTLRQRLANPSLLVDISHIKDLDFIKDIGDIIEIGANTRHAEVAQSAVVHNNIPALARLAGGIGDRHIRNLGTLGGAVANNDPSACYPAACLALKATIQTSGGHAIAAGNFFNGLFSTALNSGEIITSISFIKPSYAQYEKFVQPASRFAMVGVFVAQFVTPRETTVRVAVTGAGNNGVFRLRKAEKLLKKDFSADAIADLTIDSDNLMGDMHGTAAYRAHLIKVLLARALPK